MPREANGRWLPGRSANPGGRESKRPNIVRQAIFERREELLDILFTAASAGDLYAGRTLLDRVCPPLKLRTVTPESEEFNLLATMCGVLASIEDRLAKLKSK